MDSINAERLGSALNRLTEQVERIADAMDRIVPPKAGDRGTILVDATVSGGEGEYVSVRSVG